MHGLPDVGLILVLCGCVASIVLGLWLGTGPIPAARVLGIWVAALVVTLVFALLLGMLDIDFGMPIVVWLVLFVAPYLVARLLSRNWPGRRPQK